MTKKKKKKKISVSTIILMIVLLVGLAVMFYPSFSSWWNARLQRNVIYDYDRVLEGMSNEEIEKMMKEAHQYNERLSQVYAPFSNPEEVSDYDSILNLNNTGIMGYITIPVIKVELPIYHGTSAEVLNVAVGHLQGSSFPVGGASTHAVLSAHRGLPSARLFTDIDKLVVGDTFTVTILREIFTYEVDEILIVLPNEIDKLAIIPGEDKVTLMTCTPYGVNTHRLLVRAHRIETEYARTVLVAADCVQVDPMLVVPVISIPLLIGLIIYWSATSRKKSFTIPVNDPLSVLPGRSTET